MTSSCGNQIPPIIFDLFNYIPYFHAKIVPYWALIIQMHNVMLTVQVTKRSAVSDTVKQIVHNVFLIGDEL